MLHTYKIHRKAYVFGDSRQNLRSINTVKKGGQHRLHQDNQSTIGVLSTQSRISFVECPRNDTTR